MVRAVLASLVILIGTVAQAEEPKKFQLRWFGQSYFQWTTPSGKHVVFDPHAIEELGRPVVKADIILCTHLHDDHTMIEAVENHKSARTFYGLKETKKGKPPEWEKIDEKVGQIQIRTVPLYHDAEDGMARGKNSAFVVETEGMTLCHLGDLGHDLTEAQLKAIGKVDVLLVPVGGLYTINGDLAKKVVDQIKPTRYVVPMHYKIPGVDVLLPLDEFADACPDLVRRTSDNLLEVELEEKAPSTFRVVVLGWKGKDGTPAPAPKK